MAEGLVVWDENMSIVRANQQAQQVFGYTFEQMRADRDFSLPEGRFSDEKEQIVAVRDLPLQTAVRELRIVDSRLWYTKPDCQRVFLLLTAGVGMAEETKRRIFEPFFTTKGVSDLAWG